MIESLRLALAEDPRVAYALLLGSNARGKASSHSDVDVGIGLAKGVQLTTLDFGALVSRLEAVTRARVDLVLLDGAPPGLAYRIFRDGRPILERDRAALVARKARAILEYLDFQPLEERCARAVLDARSNGR